VAAVLTIGLFAGLPVQAQEETEARAKFTKLMDEIIDHVQDNCENDAKEFCSKVTPGKGRLLMCALAHEDKISDDCGQAIFDAVVALGDTISFLQLAADDCEDDIEKTCADVEPGEGRIAQCLIDNKSSISASCQEAVADFDGSN
jgi:hypothetical protein